MSEGLEDAPGAAGHEARAAVPLWSVGAALFAVGFLRGRKLWMLVGAGVFFADHRAEPVNRVRGLLAPLRG